MVESLLQIKKQRTGSHFSLWPASKTGGWPKNVKFSDLDSKIPSTRSIHIFAEKTCLMRNKNPLCHFIKKKKIGEHQQTEAMNKGLMDAMSWKISNKASFKP